MIEIRSARAWQEVAFATAADVRAIAELAAASVAANAHEGRVLRRPRGRRH